MRRQRIPNKVFNHFLTISAAAKQDPSSFAYHFESVSFAILSFSVSEIGEAGKKSARAMNYRRDSRASRTSLLDGFDGLEEGGIKASSSYSRELNEHDNDKALESLHDRVGFLKRLTGDIHEEAESHNRLLDRVGSGMDGSRGLMLGTMDRFKKVFEKKSTKKKCLLVAYFILAFIIIYYLFRMLGYFTLG
ncbi:hypothetical protein L6164_025801 [Bauhinia variegata]|uniref:Uncharacterized protein n=1 Tax=Bauhinia variegata TaxID=167791 RepID=A0ACB9M2P4_BAUVA|nr:hypothetical protein L6164_025801 [Bauhinia variegata]